MKLIIAEKASAARRIAEILGIKKSEKYKGIPIYHLKDAVVIPLRGHIVDLEFPKEYSSWTRVSLSSLLKAPILYKLANKDIRDVLKKYAKDADILIIATDYDREGESIGKEAINIVKEFNPGIKVKRAKFSAITEKDIKEAFTHLQDFNYKMANAADARREIDLLWGAILTRYVSLASQRLGKSFLSVGRVQTPTLSLIVSREEEIKSFKPKPYWQVKIRCTKKKKSFDAVYHKEKIFEKSEADRLSLLKADTAKVLAVEKKRLKQAAPTPFSTNDFLRAAASLGFSPKRALDIAESLYIQGYISYPRTDNTVYPSTLNLREILKKLSKSPDYRAYAEKVLSMKKLQPSKGRKKATDHPPIHPVDIAKGLSKQEKKIYDLIVRRFLATLYPPAELESVSVKLGYCGEFFLASGKRYVEKAWKEVYTFGKDKEEILPPLLEGEEVKVKKLIVEEKETKPKPRFSASALLKLMEDLGLGTKSTRAEIIQKLQSRGYISGAKVFVPSKIAHAVVDMLRKYGRKITEASMTAELEKEIDDIEKGKKKKEEVVKNSSKMLSEVLEVLEDNKFRVAGDLQKALKEDSVLGKCPKCGGDLLIIETNKGTRFVGCSGYKNGCDVSYPLPAKGKIVNLHKKCNVCGLPMIRVIRGRRYFDMCINPNCPSKKDWSSK